MQRPQASSLKPQASSLKPQAPSLKPQASSPKPQASSLKPQAYSPPRLYLDNAATSFPKPPEVFEALRRYAQELGASAGRGSYRETLETGELLADCRRRIAGLINAPSPAQIVFTLNCTAALNQAIQGYLRHRHRRHAEEERRPAASPNLKTQVKPLAERASSLLPAASSSLKPQASGLLPALPHVVTTRMEHNSVLRPLQALADEGLIEVTHAPADTETGYVAADDLLAAIRPRTTLIALVHASNVTGAIQPIMAVGAEAGRRGITFLVDAAQTAGHVPIDVQAMRIDLLALPGHKGLLGPLGTGALYIRPGLEGAITPLVQGGTGSISERPVQPDFMPDKFESGSHNALGIAGLAAGLKWIEARSVASLQAHDRELARRFLERSAAVPGLTVYGPKTAEARVAVFSVRLEGLEPSELSTLLETEFGILSRSGLHCAPLAHGTIGTGPGGGATRLSFGSLNTLADVDRCVECLGKLSAVAVSH